MITRLHELAQVFASGLAKTWASSCLHYINFCRSSVRLSRPTRAIVPNQRAVRTHARFSLMFFLLFSVAMFEASLVYYYDNATIAQGKRNCSARMYLSAD